ncbi:efflux RND transporter periplasmic adaptor subunit [Paenibacillus sp. BSR1-1]|uniref:efflux RND transporter periplasmic adaptor subunit n=1 Tax=Paenibacillus sp. BSR1-1 TaxID=3020845 RepID=UPI0025AF65D1|nr:efflux RND transporter periplasmic adaptor subunit [Paenibacillus sp. BSR1-1]MDN3017071.1 efflux RND transporter periplasmic adaptor subunit [Paenibacillus sp. BSR1-1]
MKKWIYIALGVLVAGFVSYQWYSSKNSTQTASASVRTAVVQQGKLEVKISGSGTVQPVTSEDIKSKIDNNEIDEVLAAAGDEVKKGDELITFTDGSDPVTAPADGVVTTISVTAGERVTNGQVVAHLTNYKDLQTVVQIDELDIPKIKKDQSVSLKVNAFPDQPYTGKVTAIAEEGTSTNGVSTFDVTIHIDKPDNLKVGMSTEASILTASKDNALYVPLDAIYTSNNQKYVIIASSETTNQNSGAVQKNVKTGLANEDYVEIIDGVTAGETVQLPQLATGSTSNNGQRMMQGSGFGGGFGGFGNTGGFNRSGTGQRQFGGRGGN